MAQLPYSPLSDVRPSGSVPGVSADAPAAAFGGATAEATQQLGGQLKQAGQETFETALKFQQLKNETDANNAIIKYGDVLGQQEEELKKRRGTDATDYLPEFQKSLKKSMDDIAGSIQSPMARLAFSRNATGYYERSMRVAGEYVGNESVKANIASYQGRIDTAQSQAVRNFNDPTSFQSNIGDIIDSTLTLAHTQGLDKNAANHLIQLNVGRVYQSAAAARIATGDTAGARALLDQAANTNIQGTDLPIMDRVSQLSMLKEVESKEAFDERHKDDAERMAYARQEHAEKEQAKAIGNALMTQIAKDPFSIDVTKIGQLNGLPWQERERFADILTQWQKRTVNGDPEAKGDGPAFSDAYNAIHLPADDPHKIWSESDVYALARDGKITPQGANKLIGQLKDTPQESAQKKIFADRMLDQIGKPYGVATQDSMRAYRDFMSHAVDAYEAGKQAHKTVAQLTDPNSPDYIGKAAVNFVQPMSLEAPTAPETPVKAAPLLSALDRNIKSGKEGSAEGIKALQDYVKANPKMRDMARNYAIRRGWVSALPSVSKP